MTPICKTCNTCKTPLQNRRPWVLQVLQAMLVESKMPFSRKSAPLPEPLREVLPGFAGNAGLVYVHKRIFVFTLEASSTRQKSPQI